MHTNAFALQHVIINSYQRTVSYLPPGQHRLESGPQTPHPVGLFQEASQSQMPKHFPGEGNHQGHGSRETVAILIVGYVIYGCVFFCSGLI